MDRNAIRQQRRELVEHLEAVNGKLDRSTQRDLVNNLEAAARFTVAGDLAQGRQCAFYVRRRLSAKSVRGVHGPLNRYIDRVTELLGDAPTDPWAAEPAAAPRDVSTATEPADAAG